jgi:hypothetical protein
LNFLSKERVNRTEFSIFQDALPSPIPRVTDFDCVAAVKFGKNLHVVDKVFPLVNSITAYKVQSEDAVMFQPLQASSENLREKRDNYFARSVSFKANPKLTLACQEIVEQHSFRRIVISHLNGGLKQRPNLMPYVRNMNVWHTLTNDCRGCIELANQLLDFFDFFDSAHDTTARSVTRRQSPAESNQAKTSPPASSFTTTIVPAFAKLGSVATVKEANGGD